MIAKTDKRIKFRRFSDRRTVLLLDIYETLFHHPPGPEQDNLLLQAIQQNYATDTAVFASQENPGPDTTAIHAVVGDWNVERGETLPAGNGLAKLWDLQKTAPGALTFTRVKRPPVFPQNDWDNLWNEALNMKMALLSIQILPQTAPPEVLWLLQTSYSREWSSRDRELAEEIAVLLAKARDMATEK